jgi:hypothetical protein
MLRPTTCGAPSERGISPHELMPLMRHENIKTTLRDFVGHEALGQTQALWQASGLSWAGAGGNMRAAGNNSGNTHPTRGRSVNAKPAAH